MKITKQLVEMLNVKVDKILTEIDKKTEYQEFFRKMLEKFGAKSPSELKDETRKNFLKK